MNNIDFYYRYGEVETNSMWFNPTWNLFFDWWSEFKTTQNLEDYKFYVGGKFIVDRNKTNDIDVIITGPIYDYDNLFKLLKEGFDLAINKYKTFIDLSWYDNINFFSYPKKEGFSRIHSKIVMSGIELKKINGEIVYQYEHKTHSEVFNVHPKLSYNLVTFPMEKQIKEGITYQPILLT